MGRFQLVCRLAVRDIRRRPGQTLLLLLVITAAMAALTLGLVLHGVTSKPYEQTRAATAGPDVVASSVGFETRDGISSAALGRFMALAHAPGVIAHSGPYPVAWPVLRAHGLTAYAMAEGRTQSPAAVDQPKVIQGTWVRAGGVVVEREFAEALGVHVGDHVTLGGRSFRVTGIAVTAAVPVFSQVCFYGGCSGPGLRLRAFDTGLVWLTESAARNLAQPGNPLTYYLNLRLANPGAAPAFVTRHEPRPGLRLPALTSWQSLAAAASTLVAQEQQVLEPASGLLALLAMAGVAIVAGGRLTEQDRRVGLLKAAGGTPPLVAAVLMAEHVFIALAGALVGLAAGWLAGPLLAEPGASLVGNPGPPPLTWSTGLVVAAVAVVVVAVSTLVPALRAARTSTVTALAGALRPPHRRAWLIRISTTLPVPMLLGLRLMTRRPRRAVLTAASFTVIATAIVAVLIYHATVGLPGRHSGQAAPADPGDARISQVLLVLTVAMGIMVAINATFTTWATVLDSRRFSAVVRSLGATARQTVAGLSVSQLLPALVGALLGIPAGTLLYGVVQNGGPQGRPPAWWLLAMLAGVLVGVAGLTAIPARIGVRRPVAAMLEAEVA
jgi:putative ABC transport system permease protein